MSGKRQRGSLVALSFQIRTWCDPGRASVAGCRGRFPQVSGYLPYARIARIGACITNYDWDTREAVVDALLEYENAHSDEFAVEFDVIPLEAVNNADYAEI